MGLYPIFADIHDRLAVIAGGGDVALRKVKSLLEAGARIRIIAPEIQKDIIDLQKQIPGSIEIIKRKYRQGDINGAYIVFAATGDPEVNKTVFMEAEENQILMNSSDDPENCSFFVPSFGRKGSLVLAVSTSGASPAMAAKLRRSLEKNLPENIEEVLSSLNEARSVLKSMTNLTQHQRGEILKKIINDDKLVEELVKKKEKNELENMIKNLS
ncbi:MAG: bifunctional precorrin-2 dehydrogenase/sirohydrochlorin ferrochelatase [Spirochaetota bacterium]